MQNFMWYMQLFCSLYIVLVEAAVKNLPCDYELVVTRRWPSPVQQQNTSSDKDCQPKDTYRMQAEPRGIGVIINNKNFKCNSKEDTRTGTDVDAAALVRLFTYLGFWTKCYKDLTAHQMRDTLKDVAELDHTHYDCLLVAILTHGGADKNLDVLCGIDYDFIKVSELLELFTGKTKSSLTKKPKVFFMQACRGDMEDPGVEVNEGVETDRPDLG